ncbi:MAG: glycosyltransferase [Planctomycetes bacterium]|nr:glycosyltransferase [Planctomycetota bacterium]
MSAPRLSILLPTYNGADDLERLLPALAAQKVDGGFEICAIDSSSTDRTRELLAAAGASIEVIQKSEFRHGATRNRCALRARGELLVFLSQDVVPEGTRFLAELANAFADPRTAGAYGRVLPFESDDPLTARTVLDLPEAEERELVRDLDHVGGLHELSGTERAEFVRFNNVASAIRADVFRKLPFPDIAFGEDFAWAARALTAGWRIRFVPKAIARHAHHYSPAKAYERYRVDAAFHRLVHGHRLRPTLASVARGFAYEVAADARYLARTERRGKWSGFLRSPILRGAQVLGQWVGSHGYAGGPRGEATGRMR